jgi:CubicO group peptidase (beta-lactamase class C family)
VSEPVTVESITLAELVLRRGEVVHEHYAPTAGPDTTLISWSTAKSVTHALVGLAVRDGLLDVDAPAPVSEWADDGRSAITLRQLLHMCSGLRFVEDYVDDSISHCIDMLFGAGQADVAGYAAALPLEHPPGSVFNYSSGTTNIISRIVGAAVGGGEAGMRAFMQDELFGPLGMTSADPRFDATGTFIGSSFLYCTARDFARFGQLYLADGTWAGRRLLPEGWVDFARDPAPVPVEEEFGYGAHWWLWDGHGFPGTFAAHGYEGQYIVVRPDRDLVVVRLGKTPVEVRPPVIERLQDLLDRPW